MNILIILLFTFVCTLMIVAMSRRSHSIVDDNRITGEIEKIQRLLPQTQCGDCGFAGCQPYAEAIVNKRTDINRCLPGGKQTVLKLSQLTGREYKPLYRDSSKSEQDKLAVIDESVCIGCVKCIRACPVDAIIGAPKLMHSVIDQYCTGCELCIAPCPVDCISMVEVR